MPAVTRGRSESVEARLKMGFVDCWTQTPCSKAHRQLAQTTEAVPLQLLFYVNGFYLIFYFLATLAMLLYKSQAFSYPEDFLSVDLTLLVLTAIAEVLRLYLGVRGNLTEEESLLGLSLVMTVGSVFLAVYFLVWQTYVLKTDVILNSLLLFFYGMESILKISAIAAFNK